VREDSLAVITNDSNDKIKYKKPNGSKSNKLT
jgi:hypothetical protein